jgi:O-methyltransferase
MKADDFAKLLDDVQRELLAGAWPFGIVGLTPTTLRLLDCLAGSGLLTAVEAVYYSDNGQATIPRLTVPVRPVRDLSQVSLAMLAIAADEEKEDLLLTALPHITGTPRIIVAGYGHLAFHDAIFHEELGQLLVPSLANGYPNTLTHLYQCLVNASRLGLSGAVAEFGMFKGGTPMFLSRIIERLSEDWPVIGFDSFSGFPPRRSPLDMYDHPDCVFTDLPAVRRYLEGRNVRIVAGDILETSSELADTSLVLSFIDTDNYSSARAALEIVRGQTVVGGAIVFDHFTGSDRFRSTLGERLAGLALLDDARFFNLHGTGVFYRQR